MGTLYVVATPIGNLGDFSKRAVETLENCDLILAEDTRQTIKLLNYFNIKNKMEAYHKFNEKEKSSKLIDRLKNGENIALVSDAGTPCISDPGYILVNEARKNDINVYGVPGACAAITALSISGIDTSSFSFYGFVPTENKEKKELFEKLKNSDIETKILYESPKRIIKLMEEIEKEIPDALICICSELTKLHEKSYYGKIDKVIDALRKDKDVTKGEYVIILNNKKEHQDKEDISLEAKLVDEMIKNKCSLKEAINLVNDKNKDISKKDIYNASLNIKNAIK